MSRMSRSTTFSSKSFRPAPDRHYKRPLAAIIAGRLCVLVEWAKAVAETSPLLKSCQQGWVALRKRVKASWRRALSCSRRAGIASPIMTRTMPAARSQAAKLTFVITQTFVSERGRYLCPPGAYGGQTRRRMFCVCGYSVIKIDI